MSRELVSLVKKILKPHVNSMRLMIGRCVLDILDDTQGIQVCQASLLAGEIQEMERIQDYGFTSHPIAQSAEGVAVFAGGNRENGVIIRLDDRTFRLKSLPAGQVAVYDLAGTKVLLKADGTGEFFTLTELKLGNTVSVEPAIKGLTFQGVFNSHVHIDSIGGLVSPPVAPSTPADLSMSVKVGL